NPPIPGRSWCLQHHLSVGRIFRVKATWDGFQASRITECIERSFQLFQLGGIFTPEELIDPVTQDTGAAFDRWHCIVVVCPVSQPCGDARDLNTKWLTNTFTDSHTAYRPAWRPACCALGTQNPPGPSPVRSGTAATSPQAHAPSATPPSPSETCKVGVTSMRPRSSTGKSVECANLLAATPAVHTSVSA